MHTQLSSAHLRVRILLRALRSHRSSALLCARILMRAMHARDLLRAHDLLGAVLAPPAQRSPARQHASSPLRFHEAAQSRPRPVLPDTRAPHPRARDISPAHVRPTVSPARALQQVPARPRPHTREQRIAHTPAPIQPSTPPHVPAPARRTPSPSPMRARAITYARPRPRHHLCAPAPSPSPMRARALAITYARPHNLALARVRAKFLLRTILPRAIQGRAHRTTTSAICATIASTIPHATSRASGGQVIVSFPSSQAQNSALAGGGERKRGVPSVVTSPRAKLSPWKSLRKAPSPRQTFSPSPADEDFPSSGEREPKDSKTLPKSSARIRQEPARLSENVHEFPQEEPLGTGDFAASPSGGELQESEHAFWQVLTLMRNLKGFPDPEIPPPKPVSLSSLTMGSVSGQALRAEVEAMLKEDALQEVADGSPGFYSRLFLPSSPITKTSTNLSQAMSMPDLMEVPLTTNLSDAPVVGKVQKPRIPPSINKPMAKFRKSNTGGKIFVDNENYSYHYHKRNSDETKTYWRCVVRSCKARIHTVNDLVTTCHNERSHGSSAAVVKVQEAMSQ
ncbi:serine/arginine repetitive matrix protein 1-like [Palaemon carinicauda]|uniref:serine/arginine repetitive matrix protein 1-like n=1 Tax=Palaemon carinicauda TaxID=392227 RepID=UPI0035B5F6AE